MFLYDLPFPKQLPEDATQADRDAIHQEMINKIAAKLLAFQHIFLGAEPPGDIDGLIQLIDELNQGTDLTVKFKTNSKIIKYLVDASKDTSSDKGQIY